MVLPLTPREAQVSELMAAGLSTKEIAKSYFISTSTTAKHVSTIFTKLGLNHRSQVRDWVETHRPPGNLMRTAVTFPSR